MLFACESDPQADNRSGDVNPMTEYRWDVSESAPNEYSMQIISGFFEAADGYKKDIPARAVINNGWGSGRSNMATGRATMPAPKRMEVTWFSYREDTFYHGAFDLPFEKIVQLLQTNEPKPYADEVNSDQNSRFIVGLAPQGYLVVWLSYGNHRQVIFTGKAIPVDGIPFSAVFENPEFSREDVLKMENEPVLKEYADSPHINDPEYWQRLHSEIYRYDIQVISEYTPYSFNVAYATATMNQYTYDTQDWKSDYHSVPEEIIFDYFFPDRIPVVSIEQINKEEMYTAFRKLAKSDPETLEVVIKVNGDLTAGWKYSTQVFVRNKLETIEIKDFIFKPFSNREALEDVKDSKYLMRYMNYPGKPADPASIPVPKKKFLGIF